MARLKPLWGALAPIAKWLARARALLVATDFDGTLATIVRRPGGAALPRRARAALRRIARLPGASVAVLSGRTLDSVARHVALPGVFLSGLAGLETLDARGRRRVHVPPSLRLPPALADTLTQWCARFDGAWLEDKDLALALHYRAVTPQHHAALRAGVRRRLAPFRRRVVLVPGKRVLEIMPKAGVNKAVALARAIPRGRRVAIFFFGDDENDEPAHALVRRRRGIAVAVGRTRSRAEYALQSPTEVTRFLEWLAAEWEQRSGKHRPIPRSAPRPGVASHGALAARSGRFPGRAREERAEP